MNLQRFIELFLIVIAVISVRCAASTKDSVLEESSTSQSDVVVLHDKTFEHLTQASTGSTTGDWLIKFYAPWCGHCKTLAPIYERVATELVGTVNVAKVDCTENKGVSLRFNIRGFPTMVLISKGRTYMYKDERSFESIVEFARGGFKIHEGDVTPAPIGSGLLAELLFVLRHAYAEAAKDLKARKYFTYNTVLVFLPAVFGIIIFLIIVIPQPSFRPPAQPKKRFPAATATVQPTAGRAMPPTSAKDTAHASKKDE